VPYTFSRLLHELALLPTQYTTTAVLGKSLAGIDIPVLHITDPENAKEKKNILITGRMHPGEPNSSHMLEGFIHFLNSPHKEAV
jgi:murein tripeptide amidase MpaA